MDHRLRGIKDEFCHISRHTLNFELITKFLPLSIPSPRDGASEYGLAYSKMPYNPGPLSCFKGPPRILRRIAARAFYGICNPIDKFPENQNSSDCKVDFLFLDTALIAASSTASIKARATLSA